MSKVKFVFEAAKLNFPGNVNIEYSSFPCNYVDAISE